jgi:hypothetical protein
VSYHESDSTANFSMYRCVSNSACLYCNAAALTPVYTYVHFHSSPSNNASSTAEAPAQAPAAPAAATTASEEGSEDAAATLTAATAAAKNGSNIQGAVHSDSANGDYDSGSDTSSNTAGTSAVVASAQQQSKGSKRARCIDDDATATTADTGAEEKPLKRLKQTSTASQGNCRALHDTACVCWQCSSGNFECC